VWKPNAALTRGITIGRRAGSVGGNDKVVRRAIARRLTNQMKRIVFLALVLPMILGHLATAQLPVKKVLTLEVVKKIAAAAEAKKRGATVVIVVVDDQVRDGRVAALGLPGATPLQGGIPIEFEGKVIGAIGVSGNTPQEDEDIAKVGAASAGAAIGQFRAK